MVCRTRTQTTTVHSNGAMETAFQIELLISSLVGATMPPNAVPKRATRGRRATTRGAARSNQGAGDPAVVLDAGPPPSRERQPDHVTAKNEAHGLSSLQHDSIAGALNIEGVDERDLEIREARTASDVDSCDTPVAISEIPLHATSSSSSLPSPQYNSVHAHFGRLPSPTPPRSPSTESFDSISSRSSSPSVAAPQSRTRGTPRSGPHSPHHRSGNLPVGNKRRKKASDAWTFFEYDETSQRRFCIFCKEENRRDPRVDVHSNAKGSSSMVHRSHLVSCHLEAWVDSCDKFGITITSIPVLKVVDEYRRRKGQYKGSKPGSDSESAYTRPYSHKNFVDAIVDFIVADDQSINVIENRQLRNIFLMLRESLKDSDIPHRTTIRSQVIEVWETYLDELQTEMAGALGKISSTMDMWTDPNLSPFMAATAHWMEGKIIQTDNGPKLVLNLCSDLIGFHRVPGRHDGDHLAHAFLYIIDRLQIAPKIGWITLDNASNNDKFMAKLEVELRRRGIKFDKIKCRIRCFPHIVNLASKAVLTAITKIELAVDSVGNNALLLPVDHDPIATIRALVRAIRASSIRRQYFSDVVRTVRHGDLQLLCDVDVRWSSTLLMIERALTLRPAIDSFLENDNFEDLRKFNLSELDWKTLADYKRILRIPHAFQQKLSGEKTPTLCYAIPSFEGLAKQWEKQQADYPDNHNIIQEGLDKLDGYRQRANLVPAYTLAMILNPTMKLQWLSQNDPSRVSEAKQLLIKELKPYFKSGASSSRSRNLHTPSRSRHPHVQQTPTRCAPQTPLRRQWQTPNQAACTTPRRPHHASILNTSPLEDDEDADEILGLSLPQEIGTFSTLESEVDAYLLDTQRKDDSILFWQENQLRYPTLFLLAMDILPIQGSAVPCERVFSSGKETTTLRRNRINPELMEALQMLKFSIQYGRGLHFTLGTKKEDELKELQAILDEHTVVPEDINAFVQSLVACYDIVDD